MTNDDRYRFVKPPDVYPRQLLHEDYDEFDWLIDNDPIQLGDLARQYLLALNSLHAQLKEESMEKSRWQTICVDLDRCVHGRHQGDVCGSCNGPSVGNRFIPRPGQQMGNTLTAKPIVHPVRGKSHDLDSWTPYGQ